uniref:Uncharacterized protein n=1 Tax=Rhizophora mucronata TaxID=61149 RepID=A0A2P2M918_RHIMU
MRPKQEFLATVTRSRCIPGERELCTEFSLILYFRP